MRSATLFCLFATACLGSVASCGSAADDGNLLIALSGLPSRVISLSLTATLNGTPAMSAQQVAPPESGKFGVVLPTGATGHLVLTIQATDADGCLQATGMVEATLSGKYTELPLTLTAQTPRKCGNLPGCAAGTICAYTPKPVTFNLWGIWASSATNMWAVGDNSTALHYDGTTWEDTIIPVTANLNGVWGSGPKDVWAVGQTGYIIHYNGQVWANSPNAAVNELASVYGVSPTEVWAVGVYSSIYGQEFWRWDGGSWKRVSTSPTAQGTLFGVWASSASDIYASGANGNLIHYNGSAWSTVTPAGVASDLRSVWGLGANQVFAAGAQGTILRYDGTAWKKSLNPDYAATLYALGGDATTVYGLGTANAAGNTVKGTAPFTNFAVQSAGSSDLTGMTILSNGIAWVTGRAGYLGYFDTRP